MPLIWLFISKGLGVGKVAGKIITGSAGTDTVSALGKPKAPLATSSVCRHPRQHRNQLFIGKSIPVPDIVFAVTSIHGPMNFVIYIFSFDGFKYSRQKF